MLRNKLLLGSAVLILSSFMLIACSNGSTHPSNETTLTIASPVSTAELANPSTNLDNVMDSNQVDDSVRAVGETEAGQLLVKPVQHAKRSLLGAPSCYGMKTDLNWTGDYQAVWKSSADGAETPIMQLPNDVTIIQPDDSVIAMDKFTIGDTVVFGFTPQYTDCHALETYYFGVEDDEAFPIMFEMEQGRTLNRMGHMPVRPVQVFDGQFQITGGVGAGQEFISVYSFHYDANQRTMILTSTDSVKIDEYYNNEVNLSSLIIDLPVDWTIDKSSPQAYLYQDENGDPKGEFHAINYTDDFDLLNQLPNHSSLTNDEFVDIPIGRCRLLTLDADNGTAASGITGTHDVYYAAISIGKKIIYVINFTNMDKNPESKDQFLAILNKLNTK